MKNVIIDSHHKIFYRTAGLEISVHENISSGGFYKSEDLYSGTSPKMTHY